MPIDIFADLPAVGTPLNAGHANATYLLHAWLLNAGSGTDVLDLVTEINATASGTWDAGGGMNIGAYQYIDPGSSGLPVIVAPFTVIAGVRFVSTMSYPTVIGKTMTTRIGVYFRAFDDTYAGPTAEKYVDGTTPSTMWNDTNYIIAAKVTAWDLGVGSWLCSDTDFRNMAGRLSFLYIFKGEPDTAALVASVTADPFGFCGSSGGTWKRVAFAEDVVSLQAATPGAAQTGHVNITGTVLASTLQDSVGSIATVRAGGISVTSQAQHDLLYASGTAQLARIANGTTGQVLTATTSGAPSWVTPAGGGWTRAGTVLSPSTAGDTIDMGTGVSIKLPAESWVGPSSVVGLYFKDGNVGIGTPTPEYTFTISAEGRAFSGYMKITADTDQNVGFYLHKASGLQWCIYVPGDNADIHFWNGTTTVITFLQSGSIIERGRTVAMGDWIAPTFSAGDFTVTGAGSWTVGAGDVTTYAYALVGKTMTVNLWLTDTSVAGAVDALRVAVPGGKTVATSASNVIRTSDNGTWASGLAEAVAGNTFLLIQRTVTGGAWAASTNNTHARGQITFEIQ